MSWYRPDMGLAVPMEFTRTSQGTPREASLKPYGPWRGKVRNRSCHREGQGGNEVGGVLGHTKELGGSCPR